MELKLTQNSRGFNVIDFVDNNNIDCSIQKSSLATNDVIWFGCNGANLKQFVPGDGWKDISMPENSSATTRMHLTREDVKKLLPILHLFVDTGEVNLVPDINEIIKPDYRLDDYNILLIKGMIEHIQSMIDEQQNSLPEPNSEDAFHRGIIHGQLDSARDILKEVEYGLSNYFIKTET